eukprot:scaffold3278_cov376-Prasinococcus_capsulatus_cf.AAC.3
MARLSASTASSSREEWFGSLDSLCQREGLVVLSHIRIHALGVHLAEHVREITAHAPCGMSWAFQYAYIHLLSLRNRSVGYFFRLTDVRKLPSAVSRTLYVHETGIAILALVGLREVLQVRSVDELLLQRLFVPCEQHVRIHAPQGALGNAE